jgi:tripartite-type tricarboxylate transporter receptor subunit TctC
LAAWVYSAVGLFDQQMTKRDKASYGIANPVSKVVGALYVAHAGLEAVEVQYKSAVDFANDLTSGSLDFAISDAISTRSHINAGTLRILAISGGNRSQAFPNIPTMVESGYPIDLPGWWGAFVPAETPKPIVEQLNRLFDEALKGDDVRKYFSDRGGDTGQPPATSASDFQDLVVFTATVDKETNAKKFTADMVSRQIYKPAIDLATESQLA